MWKGHAEQLSFWVHPEPRWPICGVVGVPAPSPRAPTSSPEVTGGRQQHAQDGYLQSPNSTMPKASSFKVQAKTGCFFSFSLLGYVKGRKSELSSSSAIIVTLARGEPHQLLVGVGKVTHPPRQLPTASAKIQKNQYYFSTFSPSLKTFVFLSLSIFQKSLVSGVPASLTWLNKSQFG